MVDQITIDDVYDLALQRLNAELETILAAHRCEIVAQPVKGE